MNSSPAKLTSTPDAHTRKKLGDTMSAPKRGTSLPRKSPKEGNENLNGTGGLFGKTTVKNFLFTPPKKPISRNGRLAKLSENMNKGKNEPQTTAEIFNERFQSLQLRSVLPNYEPSRNSQKAYGAVKAFGVCTNQGLVRDYNEDRVSIVLDIPKPYSKPDNEPWPNSSIFAVFDGHGGAKCADFLRNNLHYYIARNKWFPTDPEEALKEACEAAEKRYIENQLTSEDGKGDTSGSCGLVMVIVDDNCYVCNVGDSRAVVSRNGGKVKQAVTRDHKPSDESERSRVINAGGRIYQNFPTVPNARQFGSTGSVLPVAAGPHRILPGGLAISRAFGDIEAKIPKFGGNSNVLIAKPEITIFKINKAVDFIVLGSDGIFDVMSNEEVIKCVWDTINTGETSDIHELLRLASENLIKETLLKKSFDNVTAIVVAFPALEHKLNPDVAVQATTEMNNELTLSPRIKTPQKTEGCVPEANLGSTIKMSPPQNISRERHTRAEKISPIKMGLNMQARSVSRNNSRKDPLAGKIREPNKKDLEALPKILPRVNGTRPSRLSAL